MSISKYHYHRLNGSEKCIYEQIREGVSVLSNNISLPLIPKDRLASIYESVLLDNPIFFYTISYRLITDLNNRRVILSPIYRYSNEIIKQSANALNKYLRLFDVVKHKSEVEKELFVHDFCLDNFTYDYSLNEHSFSPLGLLVYNTGVCAGISKFVKIALDYLNVGCVLVSGKAINSVNQKTELHMWNIVSISGNTYHLDVTFDMSQKTRVKRYDYFNLPDVEISKDHLITTIVPKCITVGKDYYSANSLVFSNFKDLKKHIRKLLSKGKRHVVIKLSNESLRSSANIADRVLELALKQLQSPFNQNVSVEVSFNLSQSVFELTFK